MMNIFHLSFLQWIFFAVRMSTATLVLHEYSIDFNSGDDCDSTSFHCRNGICIPADWVCDGVGDCLGAEDESVCNYTCLPYEFQCADSLCIGSKLRCNGDSDCLDSSDEKNCNGSVVCKLNEVQCQNHPECIPAEDVCDGEHDCPDGSDEEHCVAFSCRPNEYRCGNSTQCIPNKWKCDGAKDCEDASDEICSQKVLLCESFVCADKTDCLEMDHVCDGHIHCPDGSDESHDCYDRCQQEGCSHGCFPTRRGVECVCPKGYVLMPSDKKIYVDECAGPEDEERPPCSQGCLNTNGSYQCGCVRPYVLEPNRRTCRVQRPSPVLLFSSTTEIRKFNLRRWFDVYDIVQEGLYRVEDMDVDSANRRVFWTDSTLRKVYSTKLSDNGIQLGRPVFVDVGLVAPRGLSYNWQSRLLYVVDTYQGFIVACTSNGVACAIIIQGLKDRDLEDVLVDPLNKHLYWTENAHPVHIMRSDLDGSNKELYLDTHMVNPDYLLIDYPTSSLYWVDTTIEAIYRVPLSANSLQDRNDKLQVVISFDVKHPSALAILEDSLVWAERRKGTIMGANKWTGKHRHRILKHKRRVTAAVIMHPALQPGGGDNPCWRARCSKVCVDSNNDQGFRCLCPPDMLLDSDGVSCKWAPTSPFLLIGSSTSIIQLPHYSIGQLALRELSAPGLRRVSTMDTNPLTQEIIFSSPDQQGNPRVCKSNNIRNRVFNYTVIEDDPKYLGQPVTLALDWVANQIFWLNTERNTIEIFKTNSPHRSRLTFEGMGGIRSFAIDLLEGLLFYSTWGDNPHITMCRMDVTECEKLVDLRIRKPDHLLAHGGKLYWSDLQLGHISSIDYQSRFRLTLMQFTSPQEFTVHRYLYYKDNDSEAVHLAALNQSKYYNDYSFPQTSMYDLTILVPRTEVPDIPCAHDNGGCSDICLSMPNRGRRCLCPVEKTLKADQQTCEDLPEVCREWEVFCRSTSRCVLKEDLCEARVQCPRPAHFVDCSESPADAEECPKDDHCEQMCTMTKLGPRCSCDHGYTLASDLRHCDDVKECAVRNGNCSQRCHNTLGSYLCSCVEGYRLIGDKATCYSADHDTAFLLVSETNGLVSVGMDGELQHAVFVDSTPPVAFDVISLKDWDTFFKPDVMTLGTSSDSLTTVVWASEGRRDRSVLSLLGPSSPKVTVKVKVTAVRVEDVTKNIYYIGSRRRRFSITLCDMRLQYCRSVLSDRDWQPVSLAFHLATGMMYWCDVVKRSVGRAFMDGREPRQMLNDVDSVPNGLAVDEVRERLYWVHVTQRPYISSIQTAKLDGSDRYTLESFPQRAFLCMDLFEGFLFLTEQTTNSLQKLSTFSSRPVLADMITLQFSVRHLRVVHSTPNMSNPCAGEVCPYLCVMTMVGARCVCPDSSPQNMSFHCPGSSPGRNTPAVRQFTLPPPPAPPTPTPTTWNSGQRPHSVTAKPGRGGRKWDMWKCRGFCQNGGFCQVIAFTPICSCSPGFTGRQCESGPSSNRPSSGTPTYDNMTAEMVTGSEVNVTLQPARSTGALSAGGVAGIVLAVLIPCLLLLAFLGWVLYRRKRNSDQTYSAVEFRNVSDEMSLMAGSGHAEDVFYLRWDLDGTPLDTSASSSDSAIFSNSNSPGPIFRPPGPPSSA